MKILTVNIKKCSACGKDHEYVTIKESIIPNVDLIGKCPDTGKVLFIIYSGQGKPPEQ